MVAFPIWAHPLSNQAQPSLDSTLGRHLRLVLLSSAMTHGAAVPTPGPGCGEETVHSGKFTPTPQQALCFLTLPIVPFRAWPVLMEQSAAILSFESPRSFRGAEAQMMWATHCPWLLVRVAKWVLNRLRACVLCMLPGWKLTFSLSFERT